jgi:hypothetical protein
MPNFVGSAGGPSSLALARPHASLSLKDFSYMGLYLRPNIYGGFCRSVSFVFPACFLSREFHWMGRVFLIRASDANIGAGSVYKPDGNCLSFRCGTINPGRISPWLLLRSVSFWSSRGKTYTWTVRNLKNDVDVSSSHVRSYCMLFQ